MVENIGITVPIQVGCMVHYVLAEGRYQGEHRPAVVVHVWPNSDGLAQLQVFTDGGSDPERGSNDGLPQVMWKTSIKHDAEGAPGTWHWPEFPEIAGG